MKSRNLYLIALLNIAVAAPVSRAVEVPVGAFPEDVSVVIRLADPTETVKKIKDLASGIDLGADVNGKVMTAIEGSAGFTGVMIDNPARQGIKPETDWWIAVIARKDLPPVMIYAVEPSDAGALKDAVAEEYEFIKHDNWTIYTKDAEAAKSIKAVLAGDAKSIESAATDNIKSLFKASDAAAFVNLKSLKVTFADEVETARQEIQSALVEAERQFETQPIPIEGVNLKAIFGLYAQFFQGMVTAFEDSNSFSAGVSFDGDGILVRELLEFQPNSTTDKALQKHKPSALSTLAKLPVNQLGYVGIHADMNAITEWGVNLAASMFNLDDAERAKIKGSLDDLKKLKIGSTAMSFGLGSRETGYINSTTVTEVSGSDVKAIQRKAYETMQGNLGGAGMGMVKSVKWTPDAEKVGDISVDVIKTELDSSEIDPSGQVLQNMMTILFGPEGMVTRMAYAPGYTVQTTGGGLASMERALKRLSASSPDDAFLATRENLAAEVNLIYMIDLPGLLVGIVNAVSENYPLMPIDLTAIESMELKRSYLGFSIATGAAALKCQSYVPRGQIQGMGSLIQFGIKQYQMFRRGSDI